MKKKNTIDRDTEVRMGDIEDFFRENDLIVAPKAELQTEIAKKQAAYLRKKFLSIREVMDGKFFPQVKTRQTIDNWLKSGKLKEGQDWFINRKGRKVILTSYLKKEINF